MFTFDLWTRRLERESGLKLNQYLLSAVDVVSVLSVTAGYKGSSEAGWMPALQACNVMHVG